MEAEARARVVVPAPAQAVYWHLAAMDLYPGWVSDLQSVERLGKRRREWRMRGPSDPLKWAVEVTVDKAPDRFGYCIEGPGVVGYTLARLYEGGATTGLSVEQSMAMDGAQADRIAKWWGDPGARLRHDLWRFKQGLQRLQRSRDLRLQGSKDLTSSLSGPSKESLFSS